MKAPAWNWKRREALLADILTAYRDLHAPRRGFVRTAESQQPYQDLVVRLAALAPVVDDTDVNCDVCFTYLIGGDSSLLLRISMVGPYAMLEADRGAAGPGLIASAADCTSNLEQSLLALLTQHGIPLLSRPALATAVDLCLPGVPRATVYNALFAPEACEEERGA